MCMLACILFMLALSSLHRAEDIYIHISIYLSISIYLHICIIYIYWTTPTLCESFGEVTPLATGHHILEPSLDFNTIVATQKNRQTLPLSTKHIRKERKTGSFPTKPKQCHKGTDTTWLHVIISCSFLENNAAFSFAFLLLLCLHQNRSAGLVFFSVPSAVKLNQVRIANNAAKQSASARWRLL